MRLSQAKIAGTATRVALAAAFLAFGVVVTVGNVKEIMHNPTLGTDYVYHRRAELVRVIEGVAKPSKREMINLDRGDGMRFLAFARDTLPEDSTVIFPKEAFDASKRNEVLGLMAWGTFKVTLYPQEIQIDSYDFRKLPYDPAQLLKVSQRYSYASRGYVHSSRHFVFHVFASPDASRYRFFLKESPVAGQKNYHTEKIYVFYPESGPK